MKNAARMFCALSEPARLDILAHLCKKKGCVSDIQLATGRNQPNVSQHMRVLRECGLVRGRREGKKIYYSVADKRVKELICAAEKIGKGRR